MKHKSGNFLTRHSYAPARNKLFRATAFGETLKTQGGAATQSLKQPRPGLCLLLSLILITALLPHRFLSAADEPRAYRVDMISALNMLRDSLVSTQAYLHQNDWRQISSPEYSPPSAFMSLEVVKEVLEPMLEGAGPEERSRAELFYQSLEELRKGEESLNYETTEIRNNLARNLLTQIAIHEIFYQVSSKADELVLGRWGQEMIRPENQPEQAETTAGPNSSPEQKNKGENEAGLISGSQPFKKPELAPLPDLGLRPITVDETTKNSNLSHLFIPISKAELKTFPTGLGKAKWREVLIQPPSDDPKTLRLAYEAYKASQSIIREMEESFAAHRPAPSRDIIAAANKQFIYRHGFKNQLKIIRRLPNLSEAQIKFLDHGLQQYLKDLADGDHRLERQQAVLEEKRLGLVKKISASLKQLDEFRDFYLAPIAPTRQ